MVARKTAGLGIQLDGDKAELAHKALGDDKYLAGLVYALGEPERRDRSRAAGILHEVSLLDAGKLVRHVGDLIDALDRPELQTRWEILGSLEELVGVNARLIDKALDPATVSLHDAESGVVRVAAFKLLAAYGATTARRAEKVWPLLDDAVRIYHGDSEYPAMLGAIVTLVEGAAPEAIQAAAADRFEPDVEDPKMAVRSRAKRIVALRPKKKRRTKSS